MPQKPWGYLLLWHIAIYHHWGTPITPQKLGVTWILMNKVLTKDDFQEEFLLTLMKARGIILNSISIYQLSLGKIFPLNANITWITLFLLYKSQNLMKKKKSTHKGQKILEKEAWVWTAHRGGEFFKEFGPFSLLVLMGALITSCMKYSNNHLVDFLGSWLALQSSRIMWQY